MRRMPVFGNDRGTCGGPKGVSTFHGSSEVTDRLVLLGDERLCDMMKKDEDEVEGSLSVDFLEAEEKVATGRKTMIKYLR